VQDILEGVDDVYFSRLTSHDVVRHKLVADIVDAYERYEGEQEARGATQRITGSRPRRAGGSRDR
jgi:phosphate starvation-inducible PhoH-like protein